MKTGDEDCQVVDLTPLMDEYDGLVEAARRADDLRQPLCPEEWLDHLAEVGIRLRALSDVMSDVTRELGLRAGKWRILRYLQAHAGEEVAAAAIEAVAGIRECPRRVRELRDEGWPIESRGSGAYYVLTTEKHTDQP